MQLHDLKRPSGLKRHKQRVGRGQASGRGKQSGRGGKGQTARAGAKIRPEWRDIIKRLPKRRGYGKNRGRTVVGTRMNAVPVSLTKIDALFAAGSEVSPKTLAEHGVVRTHKAPPVKIVGGTTKKKLTFKNVAVTAPARTAIESAGGTIA